MQIGACLGHFLLQNHNLLGLKSTNQVNCVSCFCQCLGNRQCDSTAQTTAQHCHTTVVLYVSWLTQRTYKIMEVIPFLEFIQCQCGCPHLLENDSDQFFCGAGNGQRNPLPIFIYPQNNELTCLCFGSNQGCMDRNLADFWCQHLFVYDLILLFHGFSSLNDSFIFF